MFLIDKTHNVPDKLHPSVFHSADIFAAVPQHIVLCADENDLSADRIFLIPALDSPALL